MTPDAIFRAAAMTKPVTTVAVMMLVEQGRLGLDDPVSTYLPEIGSREVLARFDAADATYTTRPAARPISIRHLLTHTSGIGYTFSDPTLAALQKAGRKEAELPLLHDPGERWTYGSNTELLGRVVEKLAGVPLDEFFRRRIFEPLGMVDTFYRVPPEKLARLVTRHERKDGKLTEIANQPIESAPVRGDGGLSSTARDYGAFLRMLLDGGRSGSVRLLSDASVRAMTSNQIGEVVVRQQPAANPALTRPFPLGAGRDRFGFGFQIAVASVRDRRSPGSYSWAGINNTHFWVDPDRRVGVVLLMQVLPFYDDACIAVLTGFEERLNRASGR